MRPMRLAAALAAATALLTVGSLARAQSLCADPDGDQGTQDGGFLFVDKVNFDRNTSCSNLATPPNYCLAGRVDQVDTSSTKNRLVVIDWESNGSVASSKEGAAKGEFSSVMLTVSVQAVIPPSEGNNCELWRSDPATPPCKLEGSTKKDFQQSRAKLSCDLGENLSGLVPAAGTGFGPITDPPVSDPTSQSVLESIEAAFLNKKNTRLDVEKGRLKVTQKGSAAPGNFDNGLTCPLPSPPSPAPAGICPTTTTTTTTTTSTTTTTAPPS